MSATTISAFAAEYEVMETQEFVASFEDASAQNVAQYCVDNGMSLDANEDGAVDISDSVKINKWVSGDFT